MRSIYLSSSFPDYIPEATHIPKTTKLSKFLFYLKRMMKNGGPQSLR